MREIRTSGSVGALGSNPQGYLAKEQAHGDRPDEAHAPARLPSEGHAATETAASSENAAQVPAD